MGSITLTSSIADTWINSDSTLVNTNYGSQTDMFLGRRAAIYRNLCKFDMSFLTEDLTCVEAILKLYIYYHYDGSVPSTWKVYRLKRNWVELQATWNQYSSGLSWSTAGAFSSNDIDTVAIGTSEEISPDTEGNTEIQISLSPTEVQKMYDGTYENYGFLIKIENETVTDTWRIHTRENTSYLYRPRLMITYSGAYSRYFSEYPPAQSSTYVKATSQYSVSYLPHFTTDPSRELIGVYSAKQWLGSSNANQRFHIDLGESKIIKRVYYENSHSGGAYTNTGAKNFTLWGSNEADAFSTLTYSTDTDWTQLTTSASQLEQHISVNTPDPKEFLVDNDIAYRYYAFKFADNWGYATLLGVRRIELQTEYVEPSFGEYDEYTKALLHFDETYDKYYFRDEIQNEWIPYTYNSGDPISGSGASIDASQYKFGDASGYFAGSAVGNWIETPTQFNFGSQDWTCDFWIRPNFDGIETSWTHRGLFGYDVDDYNFWSCEISGSATDNQRFRYIEKLSGSSVYAAIGSIMPLQEDVWQHVAFVKQGTNLKGYLSGTNYMNTTIGSSMRSFMNQIFKIGNVGTASMYRGYMDEFRLSIGIARWTSNFTPPTAPYAPDEPPEEGISLYGQPFMYSSYPWI